MRMTPLYLSRYMGDAAAEAYFGMLEETKRRGPRGLVMPMTVLPL